MDTGQGREDRGEPRGRSRARGPRRQRLGGFRGLVMGSVALAGILAGGVAGGPPAAAAASEPAPDVRSLSLGEVRQRLAALDAAHSAALAEEDFDRATQLLREINRLTDELTRRQLKGPASGPPEGQRPGR